MTQWYYKDGQSENGPIARQQLAVLAGLGRIQPDTPVRSADAEDWRPYASTLGYSGRPRRKTANGQRNRATSTPDTATPPVTTTPDEIGLPEPVSESPAATGLEPPPVPARSSSDEPGSRKKKLLIALLILLLLLLLALLIFFLLRETNSGAGAGGRGQSGSGGETTGGEEDGGGASTASSDPSEQTDPGEETDTPDTVAENEADADSTVGDGDGEDPKPPPGASDDQFLSAEGGSAIHIPKTATFFGVEAQGTRFVFAVDVSGSMLGNRLATAKRELLRSLSGLRPDAEFSVVFFDSYAKPQPGGYRKRADLPAVRKWINTVDVGGGTNVRVAVEHGLQLAPDAIFLLTDGQFDGQTPEYINSINTDRVPIHTIALVSRSGEQLLKKIAADSDGDYRFVP